MIFEDVAALRGAAGQHLGHGEWHLIDQDRVNLFAAATDDYQWIHVDPERAAGGPFGTTVAHGYLTLSLLPLLLQDVFAVRERRLVVNYGLNRVRFPAPVPVGSQVRINADLVDVTDVADAVQIVIRATLELRGGEKPAMVAETVTRVYP